jgi:hypothetical protein
MNGFMVDLSTGAEEVYAGDWFRGWGVSAPRGVRCLGKGKDCGRGCCEGVFVDHCAEFGGGRDRKDVDS